MILRNAGLPWCSNRLASRVPCGTTVVASSLAIVTSSLGTAAAGGTRRLFPTPTPITKPSPPRRFSSDVGNAAVGALENAHEEQKQDCAIPRYPAVDFVDADTPSPFVLPPPSWSLKDLNLGSRPAASAIELTPEQVKKICAIAHIDLDPDGEGSFDAASATRDVGAILRVMQSVRTGQGHGRDGAAAAESKEEGEEEMGVDREEEGPWGGAAAWAAPLQKDIVSDGDMQKDILGSAERTEDGFFTAPRVVGGGEDGQQ